MAVPVAAEATHSEPLVYRLSAATLQRNPLGIVAVAPRDLRGSVTAPARVAFAADASAHVGSLVRGRIGAVPVALGAKVRAGDVLAVVDSPELGEVQNELLLQQRTAVSTAPLVALSLREWERGKQLYEELQGLTLQEVSRRELEYRTHCSTQARAEAAAVAAQNRLRLLGMGAAAIDALRQDGVVSARHEVRAPIDGQVVERTATRGDLVGPDQAPMFTLTDPGLVWVLAEVPESRVADVVVGSEASVHVAHLPVLDCRGAVTFLAPRLDPGTRTLQARIEVREPPPALRAGMFCEVRLPLPPRAAGAPLPLVVPETAVQTMDRRPVVFVPIAGDPHAFALRSIEVGAAVDGFVPVLAGLQAGEQVVAAGSFVLKAQATQAGPDVGK